MHLGTSKHWLSKWKKKLRCFLIVFWRVQGRSFFLEIQGFWGIQKWHGGTISPWTWNGVGAKNPEFITRVYLFKFYLNNYLHFYTLSVRDGIRYYILLEVIEGCVKVHLGISWAEQITGIHDWNQANAYLLMTRAVSQSDLLQRIAMHSFVVSEPCSTGPQAKSSKNRSCVVSWKH